MGRLLAEVIPLALGAAISPLVFIAGIAVMTGPSPLRRGGPFAIGAAIPLLALTALAVILGHAFSLPEASDTVNGSIDIGLAVLLGLVGIHTLTRPAKPTKPQHRPESGSQARFVAMGAGLMLTNFTTIALYVPALKLIEESGVSAADEAIAIVLVLVVVVTLALVLVPLTVVALAPGRRKRLLKRAGDWVTSHHRAITVALCFGFGALLLVRWITAL